MFAACAEDFWRIRLMLHPKLRSTLGDVRVMSFRESIALHAALDVIDAKSAEASDELTASMERIRQQARR